MIMSSNWSMLTLLLSTSRNDRQIYAYDFGYEKVVFDVAKAAEDSRPHAAIELYHQHDVEALLVRQGHWGYRTACEYLVKRRVLFEKLDHSAGWINYLTDLRKRTNRLRAFKEEMANASHRPTQANSKRW